MRGKGPVSRGAGAWDAPGIAGPQAKAGNTNLPEMGNTHLPPGNRHLGQYGRCSCCILLAMIMVPAHPTPQMKFQIGETTQAERPLIAVSLTDREPLPGSGMDIAELRIDAFQSQDKASIRRRIAEAARAAPVLVTIRLQAELGQWDGSEKERLALFQAVLDGAAAVDIEIQSAIAREVIRAAQSAGKQAIASWHGRLEDADLAAMAEQGAALGADAIKIAAFADSLVAVRALAETLLEWRKLPLIAVGMGRFGPLCRLLLPALGSPLAYAYPDGGEARAPGQLSLGQTRKLLATLYPPATD